MDIFFKSAFLKQVLAGLQLKCSRIRLSMLLVSPTYMTLFAVSMNLYT